MWGMRGGWGRDVGGREEGGTCGEENSDRRVHLIYLPEGPVLERVIREQPRGIVPAQQLVVELAPLCGALHVHLCVARLVDVHTRGACPVHGLGIGRSWHVCRLCEVEELVARLLVGLELAEERRGDCLGVGLLDAAGAHAHVLALEYDAHPEGVELFHQRLRNLLREPLLHLAEKRQHAPRRRRTCQGARDNAA